MSTFRFGAVLLAAGLGSRFVAGDKLLHPYRGRPVLEWALSALTTVSFADRVIVIGPDDDEKRALAHRHAVRAIVNPAPLDGMGPSLALGIAALAPDLDGALVCLGDMPGLSSAVFEAVMQAFAAGSPATIVVPSYHGQRGHPVLFGREHFAALMTLRGDQGAREILKTANVVTLALDDPGIIRDIDTVADLDV